jgi:diaminopimelate decarboxylase
MTEKRAYMKPTIVRHNAGGVLNKFGRPPQTVPMRRIEGFDVAELAGEYGSPVFVLSVRELRQRYRDMNRAFATRYPDFQIAYSYKTNYLKSVCSILHQEGAWAEVVSGFEYDIAFNLGVPGNQIIFNGPYKTRDELRRAFENGSVVNIDNYDELQVVEEIADELGRTLDVGIRINMDLNDPPWHKFGFNYEAGHAFEAVKRLLRGGKLKLVGLHMHTGTYVDDVSIYARGAQGFVDFYNLIRNQFGVVLKYWDLGGGYASQNTLHVAYLPAEQTCPTFDQYAEAVCNVLLAADLGGEELPKLFIEPGRALVDEPFYLITSVAAQKRLPTGRKAIVLDTGMNTMSSIQWYRYKFQTAQDVGTTIEDTTVYGGLCMNIDVINHSLSMPPVRRGELLVIPHVGAYNISQSWQFIYLRPAVIAIDEGKVNVIKRPETREYVQEFEELPKVYQLKGNSPTVN